MMEHQARASVAAQVFPQAPRDFSAGAASDEELRRYGFPPRPAASTPIAERFWNKTVGRPGTYVAPEFGAPDTRIFGPPRIADDAGPGTAQNWSGGVAVSPPGMMFSSVGGLWTVPDPYPPAQDNTLYDAAVWVGLDGWPADGSRRDVLQVGTNSTVTAAGGAIIQRQTYLWYEWYPGPPVPVTSLAVAPGDIVAAWVQTLPAGAGAIIYVANLPAGTQTSFVISPPRDWPGFQGNTAEWIVEPFDQSINSYDPLPDYGYVFFKYCWAIASQPDPLGSPNLKEVDLGSADAITMTSSVNGTPLSVPTFETNLLMSLEWAGSA